MSSRTKLLAAREFIQAKEYDVARVILEHMPDNPTAQSWMKKLDEISGSKPTTPVLSDLKAVQLVDQIANDEAYRELLFRAAKCKYYGYDSDSRELWSAIALRIADEKDNTLIDRICKIVDLLPITDEDDPVLEQLIVRLQLDEEAWTVAQSLRKMDVIEARRALLAYPLGQNHETNGITIIESENVTGALKQYRVMKAGSELFSMSLVKEGGRYRPTYPDLHKLIQYFDVVSVIRDIAEVDAQGTFTEERIKRDEINGYATYYDDIAPYLDDYDPPINEHGNPILP